MEEKLRDSHSLGHAGSLDPIGLRVFLELERSGGLTSRTLEGYLPTNFSEGVLQF
jgi:hypothetical protein